MRMGKIGVDHNSSGNAQVMMVAAVVKVQGP